MIEVEVTPEEDPRNGYRIRTPSMEFSVGYALDPRYSTNPAAFANAISGDIGDRVSWAVHEALVKYGMIDIRQSSPDDRVRRKS
jgi:hypothetical protein